MEDVDNNFINNLLQKSSDSSLKCPKCDIDLLLNGKELIINKVKITKEDKDKINGFLNKINSVKENKKQISNKLSEFNTLLENSEKPLDIEIVIDLNFESRESRLKLLQSYIPVNMTMEQVVKKILLYKNNQEREKFISEKNDNYLSVFNDFVFPENLDEYYTKFNSNKSKKYFATEQLQNIEEKKEIDIEKYLERKNKINEILDKVSQYKNILNIQKSIEEREQEITEFENELKVLLRKKEFCLKLIKTVDEIIYNILDSLLTQLNESLSEIMEEFFDNSLFEIHMF